MYLFIFIIIVFGLLSIYLRFRRRVPILMYHRIARVPGDRNALPPEKFREQLNYLKSHGYHTITLDDLYLYYHDKKQLPQKPVLLTFDDGYIDNFFCALPLLQEYRMKATVFPISGWIGKENKWEKFHKALTTTMSWNELKQWHKDGMQIGCHTVNHPFLSQLTNGSLKEEIVDSKDKLEIGLDIEIEYFCYPYGDFNTKTKKAVQDAGYKVALGIFEHVPLWNIDLFSLPRIPIPSQQRMWEFKLKVSSIHMVFVALRQLERWFKHKTRNKNKIVIQKKDLDL